MARNEFFADVTTEFFSIIWTDRGQFQQKIENGGEETMRKIFAVMEYKAPQVEAHMKTNASWTDQTGNARQGLSAQAFREGDNAGIVLFHQVPYGIWLELKNSGKYAIILPTIDSQGPEVMRSIERILEEI